MDEESIYRAALEKWGADAQTLMVFEEMAELQKELCKHARGKDNREAIAEEIADVEIMLGQMKILHDCTEAAAAYRESKLRRLAIRCGLDVDGEPEPQSGQHMTFRDGRVRLEPGAEINLGQPLDLEDLIRKTVAETFKAWTATAKDGGCIVITEDEAAEIERAVQEAGPGMIVNLAEGDTPPGTASAAAAWKVLQVLGYVNDTPFKETQDFLRKVQKILEILEQSGTAPEYWGGVIGMAATFDVHMRG